MSTMETPELCVKSAQSNNEEQRQFFLVKNSMKQIFNNFLHCNFVTVFLCFFVYHFSLQEIGITDIHACFEKKRQLPSWHLSAQS